MRCDNIFCIYWTKNHCSLNKISLDIQGNCESCIYVDIEDNVLESYRKKLLSKYAEIQIL